LRDGPRVEDTVLTNVTASRPMAIAARTEKTADADAGSKP